MLSVDIWLIKSLNCRFYEFEVDILVLDKKLLNCGKNLFVKRYFSIGSSTFDASFKRGVAQVRDHRVHLPVHAFSIWTLFIYPSADFDLWCHGLFIWVNLVTCRRFRVIKFGNRLGALFLYGVFQILPVDALISGLIWFLLIFGLFAILLVFLFCLIFLLVILVMKIEHPD